MKKKLLLPGVVAIAAAIAVALGYHFYTQAQNRFDLVCEGQLMQAGIFYDAKQRFHFDLGERRYCRGKCATTEDIASITPVDIIASREVPPYGNTIMSSFNRETGEYAISGNGEFESGKCRRAEFSGLPERKF